MSEITREEARDSLGIIDDAMGVVRRAVERVGGKIVLGWGMAYLVGPLAVHFWGNAGMIVLNFAIVAAVVWTAVASSNAAVKNGRNGSRFGLSWVALFGFGALWFLVLMPEKLSEVDETRLARQIWVYGVSLAMFMYVLMGLWWGRVYLVLGLAVTAATVAGLFFVPTQWFWLWSGIAGGSLLLGGGLWLVRSAGGRS